jgi:hypothetical protein
MRWEDSDEQVQVFNPPLELPLPRGPKLLLHHHLPRVQRFTLPTPHRAFTSPVRGNHNLMVCLVIWVQLK